MDDRDVSPACIEALDAVRFTLDTAEIARVAVVREVYVIVSRAADEVPDDVAQKLEAWAVRPANDSPAPRVDPRLGHP